MRDDPEKSISGDRHEFIRGIVASYPSPLQRAVNAASVTRAFTRELMLVLLVDAGTAIDDLETLFDELISLPIVERRPNAVFALHETTRGPLLADLWQRDREFALTIAQSASDYFSSRIDFVDTDWADFVELVYYELLIDPDGALVNLDEAFDASEVSAYPARRAALIGIAAEQAAIGLLGPDVARWTSVWRLEDLAASEQWRRLIETATSKLGIDPTQPQIADSLDARVANALGLAYAGTGKPDIALSLFDRVILSTSETDGNVLTAHLRSGDVLKAEQRAEEAEEAYVRVLGAMAEDSRFGIKESWSRRLLHFVPGLRRRSRRGSLAVRDPAAWHLVPIALTGSPADEADEPSFNELYLLFVEGVVDDSGDATVGLLVEVEDGSLGAYVDPDVNFALLWGRLADLYVDSDQLEEAHTAAALSGMIAEIFGDANLMSDAFDILARIGSLEQDPEFLRFAESANRDLLEAAIETGDESTKLRSLLRLGWHELGHGRVAPARDAFAAARRIAEDLHDSGSIASSLVGFAEAAAQGNDAEAATAALLEAIAVYEQLDTRIPLARTHLRLGDLYIWAGNLSAAGGHLTTAYDLFRSAADTTGQADALESMARAAARDGRYDESASHLDAARSLAQDRGDKEIAVAVELTAGALLEARYEPEEAAELYRRALDMAEGPLYGHLRAECQVRLGDAAIAYHDYKDAADRYSQAAELHRVMGNSVAEYQARSSLVTALAYIPDPAAVDVADELVKELPSGIDVHTRTMVHMARVTAMAEMGDEERALRVLNDPTIVGDLNRVSVMASQADVLSSIGRFAESLARIDDALEIETLNADLYGTRAWCLLGLEPPRPGEAAAAYRKAIELAPDNPWFQKGLAECLLATGNTDEAGAIADSILERFAGAGVQKSANSLLSLLGFCAYLVRRYDDAVGYLEAAVAGDSRDYSSMFDLALVELCRQSAQAEDLYDRALERLARASTERRRGIIAVAIIDVNDAIAWRMGAEKDAAAVIVEKMRAAITA